MDRAVISKLLEVDPEFAPFLAALHGVSKMHDASEVHVTGGDPKRERRLAQAGLAATGVATLGGAHAIKATIGEHRGVPKKPGKVVPKLAGKLKLTPKTAALIGTGGWLGLHGVELAGDALAARAQTQAIKATPKSKKVAKGVIGHMQPKSLVQANARARKAGLRGTLQPVVAKGIFTEVKSTERAIRPLRMPQGAHRPKGPKVDTGPRHQAMPEGRKLTRAGKLTAVAAPTTAVAGGAEEAHRRGQVAKSLTWTGEISKVNVEKRQVFGWASLSMIDGAPVTDRQGDYIPIEESEDAAYSYMLTSRKGGDMHTRIGKADGGPRHTADVIESIVFTPEKIEALGLEPDAVPLGWWLGMQIHDEQQWQDVKDGKRTGFSVHGTGTRKDMVLA
jgi:hypothetical protein